MAIQRSKTKAHVNNAMGWKKKSIIGVGRMRAMTMFWAQTPCQRSMRLTKVFVRLAKSSSVGVVSALRYQPGESLETVRERGDDEDEDGREATAGRMGEGVPIRLARALGIMFSMCQAVRPFSMSEVVFIVAEACLAARWRMAFV